MTHRRPSRAFRASCALALAVLAAGCARAPRRESDTLRFALAADITGIFPNPPINNEAFTFHVNRNLFEGLAGFDERFRLEPVLAESWVTPDARTYLFTLRPGLRFSDGTQVTAADVVASLQAAQRRGWVTRDYLQAIESVMALDEARVEIRTRSPYLILLHKMPFGFVLPARAVDQTPVPPIGTGRYRLASWQPGRELVLVRNPHHRGPPAHFARARFQVVKDAAERVRMVQEGAADVADHVPHADLARLAGDARVRIVAKPGVRVLFLCLRVDRPPFSDPRVREAVELAIDRDEVVRRAFDGTAAAASQLVPPAIVGFNPDLRAPAADIARARALLRAAGYPKGLTVTLDGPNNRYVNDERLLHEVARQLEAAGIRVRVEATDKLVFFDKVDTGRSLFHLMGWLCETGDAGDLLDSVLHSRKGGNLGGFNTVGLADDQLDRLIDSANESVDLAERLRRLQAAMVKVAATRAVIPLVVPTEVFALSPRVEWDSPVNLSFELRTFRAAKP